MSSANLKRPAIVLAHGLVHPLGAACDAILQRSYFVGVPEYLRRQGYRVLDPKVSNMGHVHDRAKQLRDRITAWSEREPGERVVVIGHSMGGLDARWMVSQLEGNELVRSLVSIGTPHQGCCIADIVVDQLAPVADITERLHRVGMSLKAIDCLTTRYMQREFNTACQDSPDVSYYSVAGRTDRVASPLLKGSFRIVSQREGPNDGMVSLRSASWGTHLGTFPVDHFTQVLLAGRGTADMYRTILRALDPRPVSDGAEAAAVSDGAEAVLASAQAAAGDARGQRERALATVQRARAAGAEAVRVHAREVVRRAGEALGLGRAV